MSDDRRTLLLQALQAVEEMKQKLHVAENAAHEALAIVGMGCRFPGASSSPDAFWNLLSNGVDAVREVPSTRWKTVPLPDGSRVWHAGLVEGLDQFDPKFFGISAREAVTIDPQQRLVLETAWEALEHAGINPQRLVGSRTGVFIGITGRDYGQLILNAGHDILDGYAATGTSSNAAAGRLSFVLGLQGPSVAIDTACSSSLTAIHLACQSLRLRECRIALAGGTNVLLSPDPFICCDNWGMLAGDGRCKTFDARADGFVRGEGCGVLVLKRLSDAVADGDHILAVIRGTAVNQDGRSSGLTVPNGPAQETVIRQALANARLQPSDIDYVEAHGTGTSLGDPIEAHALAAVLGEGRTPDRPLVVGSVKTNIGHLESAAGVAGVIKTVLSLQHESIPANLHFQRMNPGIDWMETPVEVPVRAREWKRGERPRRAGVSSFGFSGTNAHVILEEAPAETEQKPAMADRAIQLLALSAQSETSLQELTLRYRSQLNQKVGAPELADVCRTANLGRAHLPERVVYAATTREELKAKLTAVARGQETPGVWRGRARGRERLRVAFLFSGQGGQYPHMSRELYETEPVFREAVDACAKILEGEVQPGILDILYGSRSDLLDDTYYTQPALFAVQYGLARLWQSWGVQPSFVLGHSAGEYAAACIAGFFSLEQGIRFMAARGRLTAELPKGEGGMAAILAPEEQVIAAVARSGGRTVVAGLNGPENVVISGWRTDVERIAQEFSEAGMRAEVLRVWHGAHSPLVEPMVGAFGQYAAQIDFRPPSLAMVSTVTGQLTGLSELSEPAYWQRQVREAVRFRQAMQTLDAQGCELFIEIGPGPALLGMGRQSIGRETQLWAPSLRRARSESQQMGESLAELYVRGVGVNWDAYMGGRGGKRVPLPLSPFERQRYWINDDQTRPRRGRQSTTAHPLLGERVELADRPHERVWQSELDTATLPWVVDHQIQGRTVLPATAYVEMAIAAARDTFGEHPVQVTSFNFLKPIFITQDVRYRLQSTLTPGSAKSGKIEFYSKVEGGDGTWVLNASAQLEPAELPALLPSEVDNQRGYQEVERAALYSRLAELGNDFGPSFQLVSKARLGAESFVSEVEIPEELAAGIGRYYFHPAVADACGHGLSAIRAFAASEDGAGVILGEGIDEVCIYDKPSSRRMVCRGQIERVSGDPGLVRGSVTVEDAEGRLVACVTGVRLRYLESQGLSGAPRLDDWFYRVDWEEFTATGLAPDRTWVVTGEAAVLAGELATMLQTSGLEAMVCDGEESAAGILASLEPGQPAAIVYTGGLNAHEPADGESPGEATGCAGLLRLVNQLLEVRGSRDVRLYVVTRGAQSVAGSQTAQAIWQAPLWGFGRIAGVEHRELWGGLVDLDPAADDASNAELLCGVLNFSGQDNQIAIRGGRLFCPRLDACKTPETTALQFHPDSAYLITGGLGGLGLETARWMAERGAGHLVLVSRTALPDRSTWAGLPSEHPVAAAVGAIEQLEARGVSVETAAVDVADQAALRQFLHERTQSDAPPIRGVIHAAGVMLQESITRTSAQALDLVLRPKLAAWNLCRQFEGHTLDFLVLFSSAAAIHGIPGQAGYAAANAFLDVLPYAAAGQPVRSINWGLWTETGMAVRADSAAVRTHAERGLGGMTTEQGLAALARFMSGSESGVAVIPLNWRLWMKLYPDHASAPMLSRVLPRQQAGSETGPKRKGVLERLAGLADEAKRQAIEEHLAGVLAAVSGYTVSDIDPGRGVTEYGIDSLMAVEFKNRVQAELGNVIDVVQLLAGASIGQIAKAVQEKLRATDAMPEAPAAPAGPTADEVDQLSDDEVEAMLAELTAGEQTGV